MIFNEGESVKIIPGDLILVKYRTKEIFCVVDGRANRSSPLGSWAVALAKPLPAAFSQPRRTRQPCSRGLPVANFPVAYPVARVELVGLGATGRELPGRQGQAAGPLQVCFARLLMETKGPPGMDPKS